MSSPREGRLGQVKEQVTEVMNDLFNSATWIEFGVKADTFETAPDDACWRSFETSGWMDIRIRAFVPKIAGRVREKTE